MKVTDGLEKMDRITRGEDTLTLYPIVYNGCYHSLLVKYEAFNAMKVFGEPPGCLEGQYTPVT